MKNSEIYGVFLSYKYSVGVDSFYFYNLIAHRLVKAVNHECKRVEMQTAYVEQFGADSDGRKSKPFYSLWRNFPFCPACSKIEQHLRSRV